MGDLSEFSFKYRLFLKTYRWRRIAPVPWTPLKKPLRECRLLLVSSAGIYASDQEPFDKSIRGGDPSYREIPADVDASTLKESHRSKAFDHTGIRQDPNLAFPIDRLRELTEAGHIGSLNHRHLSFMGSVTAPGRLIKRTIPFITPQLLLDKIDIALLIPVWPVCNQTVGLVAAELERLGISTVVIQLLRLVTEKVRPPRALCVPFPHGCPLGSPNDPQTQHAVLAAALSLLENRELKPPGIVEFREMKSEKEV